MKLYPPYKEAARHICESDKDFFSFKEIADMLEVEIETQDWQFGRMKVKQYALDEYSIDLIPTANEHKGRGYKKATDEEMVTVTCPRLNKKGFNTIRKHRKILTCVDTTKLSDKVMKLFERNVVKNLLEISLLEKSPLKKCTPGMTVSVGTPKLYNRLINKLNKPDTDQAE